VDIVNEAVLTNEAEETHGADEAYGVRVVNEIITSRQVFGN
jgi:hypothetical protein